ncbi:MAG: dihydroorotase [Oscillospiraceae bacterium]|nr:dihydroorotase [Oscillospiraceae bacterium]
MLLIKGRETDILIKDGKIAEIARKIPVYEGVEVLNAERLYVSPGLVDMHVHFREPGFEYKENISTGSMAAAAGGVTTCLCMPNTSPVIDSAEGLAYIAAKAKASPIHVLQCAAVTVGQKGRELTDFAALKSTGATALSDDGVPIQHAELLRRAMIAARELDMLIISHCEDDDLAQNHAVNEGRVSAKLGLPGRPKIAEELQVARDAMLARDTGARVHIAHVSSAGSVDIIRKAKAAGVNITAETCPQYFALTEDEILEKGTLARVNPPLRTREDVDAIIRGLIDGTIDAIVTDHAPHSTEEKSQPLESAPSGMIGLETSLGLSLTYLYHTGILSLERVIELMSINPARILGISGGTLEVGAPADIVIFDPDEAWTVDPAKFKSKARNTLFGGMKLQGRVKYTIAGGDIVYRD